MTVSTAHLNTYIEEQGLAEQMIPSVGSLYRNRGVIVTVFGRKLMNGSTIDIIKAHQQALQVVGEKVTLLETSAVLNVLTAVQPGSSRIDIGKLAFGARQAGLVDEPAALLNYVKEALQDIPDASSVLEEPRDVVLYGFGRIGRILARLLIERTTSNNPLRLRAIVVRGGREGDLRKRASLLRRDSIHGPFNGHVSVDEENSAIIANGNFIKVIYANQPEDIDYTAYDIHDALIVDNTGVFKDEAALSRHLVPKGARKVLLTAPASGAIKNIVYGVNHDMIEDDDMIVCAASCTTNAITPVLKIINDRFGVINGHVETVHSYTNDQNLIDNYHSADRRGRSAPLNMVLTSTGAAKAVSKALPELEGKLTGNAIRVPTPNVSMAVCNLNLEKATNREELNDYVREIAYNSALSQQVSYSYSTEVVSTDFVGTPEPAIFDSVATIVDGNRCVLYVWYDNEFGYSTQVLRVMQHMVGLHIQNVPAI
ncbi:glyceraldehyde-3-phosphate dehydrogenase [Granulosicoccus antarcticus]|uniref:Glyceraldehyde-3-phosphate dehydrogenase-like protein n=1 Tax=Granulosicoccus antarcticus IMCC3135 TaxID=1192854 RepID=A0A2Z2NS66_9GAMM|nr:glyceraldehyde-3-phosphate dehydrogenase [Granulosicoccus antarcticus]ASJ74386.1 Glyceraldehyde-3-phosphate dehydrogenase-like protein [Granulosicoccus antarcticus IMCC3135]